MKKITLHTLLSPTGYTTALGLAALCLAALSLAARSPLAVAQQPGATTGPAGSQPASQPADELISGTIQYVKGDVRVRDSATGTWRAAKVGMVLTQGGEIQTGIKSQVDIFMPPAQRLSVDRMSTVKLVELARYGDKIKSNIGMQYGRTQLNIEKSGMVQDAKFSTPSTTLALRGTNVLVYDQAPFAPTAVSFTGRAEAKFRGRSFNIAFGTNRFTEITDGNDNPADQAQTGTGVNLRPNPGTTDQEQVMVSRYPTFNGTGGGIINGVTAVNKSTSTPFGRSIDNSGEANSGGLTFPLPNPNVVNGQLDMSLSSPQGSNVRFTVISPFNEFISQQFGTGRLGATFTQTTTESGNMQNVTWSTKYPEGNYILRAQGGGLSSSSVPVQFQVRQDGLSPMSFNRTLTNSRPNANIDLSIKKGSTPAP